MSELVVSARTTDLQSTEREITAFEDYARNNQWPLAIIAGIVTGIPIRLEAETDLSNNHDFGYQTSTKLAGINPSETL